jgi:hypothetical protein
MGMAVTATEDMGMAVTGMAVTGMAMVTDMATVTDIQAIIGTTITRMAVISTLCRFG